VGICCPAAAIGIRRRGVQDQTVEQGMRGQGNHRQHGDFSERIETAKIDQDDIDDVGAAAAGNCLLQIESRDGLERRGKHLQGDQPEAATGKQASSRSRISRGALLLGALPAGR
jgi:hypothetical protein